MRRAIWGIVALIPTLATSMSLSPVVLAEHLPDHRYSIVGTVTNELGEPVCGVTVRAADIDQPFVEANRTAVTDASGAFQIQLHLHDSYDQEFDRPRTTHNVGDKIRVSIEGGGPSTIVLAEQGGGDSSRVWGQQNVDLFADGLRGTCISPVQLAVIGFGILGAFLAVVFAVRILRRPGILGRGARADLLEIPGLGRARARELQGVGIRSVEQLAATSPQELAAGTTLTPKQANLLVKRANEALSEKA